MAKKKAATPKITKTAAIREELRRSKDGSPSAIAKRLIARGIKVSPEYVSTIKASDKRKAQSGSPRRKPGRPASPARELKRASAGSSNLREASELLEKAFELVLLVGEKEAIHLVSTAARMADRLAPRKD